MTAKQRLKRFGWFDRPNWVLIEYRQMYCPNCDAEPFSLYEYSCDEIKGATIRAIHCNKCAADYGVIVDNLKGRVLGISRLNPDFLVRDMVKNLENEQNSH